LNHVDWLVFWTKFDFSTWRHFVNALGIPAVSQLALAGTILGDSEWMRWWAETRQRSNAICGRNKLWRQNPCQNWRRGDRGSRCDSINLVCFRFLNGSICGCSLAKDYLNACYIYISMLYFLGRPAIYYAHESKILICMLMMKRSLILVCWLVLRGMYHVHVDFLCIYPAHKLTKF
jgi:hypothetical protein